jgi:hypothetical protein
LTEAEKELGPGLSIYFRQLKMLLGLFAIFSVFALPLMLLNSQASNEHILAAFNNAFMPPSQPLIPAIRNKFQTFFFDFSLANLGKSDFPCEALNLSDLRENFSGGPMLVAGPIFDANG